MLTRSHFSFDFKINSSKKVRSLLFSLSFLKKKKWTLNMFIYSEASHNFEVNKEYAIQFYCWQIVFQLFFVVENAYCSI